MLCGLLRPLESGKRLKMKTSVGIDISKGKSMVAAIASNKKVVLEPVEFLHTQEGLSQLEKILTSMGENTRIIMEATGHYHEPVSERLTNAKFFVSVVNPTLIFDYGNNTVRQIKTDKKDALKIARYGIDHWEELREYVPEEKIRQQLKAFSRQYNLCIKTVHSLENNLITLLDKTFPGLNRLFSSQKRKDGHQKWVDFAATFWHSDIIARMTETEFVDEYKAWCAAKKYQFKVEKAHDVYAASKGHMATLSESENTHLLIFTAVQGVINTSITLASFKLELIRLAKLLPEYVTVSNLYGVGALTAAQLMAEIGDVRRFHSRKALVAFAGIDPLPHQSGKLNKKSTQTSKRGSAPLRKTLFQIVSIHLRHSPEGEPVFEFLNRKRAEGKPYFVYMTAAANKFLRIYYARVSEFLNG